MDARRPLGRVIRGCGLALVFGLLLAGCGGRPFVVVYTSQDQVYAEPIFAEFTRQTGIEVRAVYDSEAVKTVGLVNRLIAEKDRPQCDVFWNNEELRTRQLEKRGLFRGTNGWAGFGYRSRRLVVNSAGGAATEPTSFVGLTNAQWRGRVALAYPMYGTTATHFLALRQHWGEERWLDWCRSLAANRPLLVDGNSVVVKLVARGEAVVGMTDSDDIASMARAGHPVAALPVNPESLLIRNTVAVLRGAPRPEAAQRLFEFLQSETVVRQLVAVNALEGASVEDVTVPTIQVDWKRLLDELDRATEQLKGIFLR